MIDLTALTLLPQEQLTLASTHESQEMHRYRRLALSFLPNAPHVSHLMAALGKECEQRLDTLRRAAERLELGSCVMTDKVRSNLLANVKHHFFIVDDAMARQVLEQALEATHHSRHFFAWLLETNATPELHEPFLACVRQKQAECHVLQECQEQHGLGVQQHIKPEEARHRARAAWLSLSAFGQSPMAFASKR
ncbi:hypothetical protein GCM10007160_00730 [Litchfieldella qijiaojingensis]|uniref:Uncharacterized protein n=1 Tax=Litchfieldella qijiaojingensis TaxID=980347 RepID=A0ABQ2Y9T2_9GAMM|nr:hypothetical protein [Halomonas qijiaojingensis]GGX77387.1 hypothetical protein GCM10007160_00730 [Halomonas qijiaojingensis]